MYTFPKLIDAMMQIDTVDVDRVSNQLQFRYLTDWRDEQEFRQKINRCGIGIKQVQLSHQDGMYLTFKDDESCLLAKLLLYHYLASHEEMAITT